jgi:hypothetical protein
MQNPFRNAYERLSQTPEYKKVDWRLKWIGWSVAIISGASTAYANGYSHAPVIGHLWAIVLGVLTLAIVEGALFTLEAGLRSTFKGGTQRTLAWVGKWTIKLTMIGNAAYLCCVIGGVLPPPWLHSWNRWSFAVHFAIGLILVPMIRDSDPVVLHRMLELRSETAQEDQIIARMAAALASPFTMFAARMRGFLDGLTLGFRLLRNKEGFSPDKYIQNSNQIAAGRYKFVEGGRQLGPGSPAQGDQDDEPAPPPGVKRSYPSTGAWSKGSPTGN